MVDAAEAWARTWPLGSARVEKSGEWRGVRGAWLHCSDPGIYGEELGRVLILEDDVFPTADFDQRYPMVLRDLEGVDWDWVYLAIHPTWRHLNKLEVDPASTLKP